MSAPQRSRSRLIMSSTGVPPTGRSRAAANLFSGFHPSNRLTAGSSVTGVSIATGVFRSRTRIEPCFRALRTQAPVLRCSSRIEISFMCDIVTLCGTARQRGDATPAAESALTAKLPRGQTQSPAHIERRAVERRLRGRRDRIPRGVTHRVRSETRRAAVD